MAGFRTNKPVKLNAWGTDIELPVGTPALYVAGLGGGYAVADEKWLADVTGNSHDPKYRYLWLNSDDVEPA